MLLRVKSAQRISLRCNKLSQEHTTQTTAASVSGDDSITVSTLSRMRDMMLAIRPVDSFRIHPANFWCSTRRVLMNDRVQEIKFDVTIFNSSKCL